MFSLKSTLNCSKIAGATLRSSIILRSRQFHQTTFVKAKKLVDQEIYDLVPNSGRVDLATANGKYMESLKLSEVLKKINREENMLVAISVKANKNPSADPKVVCKILPKRVDKKNYKQKSEEQQEEVETESVEDNKLEEAKKYNASYKKGNALKVKKIVVDWDLDTELDPSSLEEKTERIKRLLGKGHTVQIFLRRTEEYQNASELSKPELEKLNSLKSTFKEACESIGAVEADTSNVELFPGEELISYIYSPDAATSTAAPSSTPHQKKPKTPKVKQIVIKWGIAPNDLLFQKKSIIQNFLKAGNPVQIFLGKSNEYQNEHNIYNLTPIEKEKHRVLVQLCRDICEEVGAVERNSSTIFKAKGQELLYYSLPKN